MKDWDLSGPKANLEEETERLVRAWRAASQHWEDAKSRQFAEAYLEPLQPHVLRALDAIQRIDEILAHAHRELSEGHG